MTRLDAGDLQQFGVDAEFERGEHAVDLAPIGESERAIWPYVVASVFPALCGRACPGCGAERQTAYCAVAPSALGLSAGLASEGVCKNSTRSTRRSISRWAGCPRRSPYKACRRTLGRFCFACTG